MIDVENKKISVAGLRKPLYFDKILVAWGADKNRLEKSYANVHYIEDRFSHAKVHN
jgi:NADH dehydrogenase FAD-containing subunit